MYAAIKMTTSLLILLAAVLLMVWIYRPGSKAKYAKQSKTALKDDMVLKVERRKSAKTE